MFPYRIREFLKLISISKMYASFSRNLVFFNFFAMWATFWHFLQLFGNFWSRATRFWIKYQKEPEGITTPMDHVRQNEIS